MTDTQSSMRQTMLIVCLLIPVILIGAGLRLYNPLWDQGTFPHPDERSTLLFYATRIRLPDQSADLLDPRRSTLNPFWDLAAEDRRSYTYGHFPLYGLVAASTLVTEQIAWLERLAVPPDIIALFTPHITGQGYAFLGRVLVALLDTLSIYLVFLIGRRLYGAWAGLLAAACSAFAVLHIQLAHFFAVDPVSTTFVLWAIYGALLMLDRRTGGAALLTGVTIGLAVSSKYSAFPIVLAPALAGLFIIRDYQAQNGGFALAARLVSITAASSFITFALTSPFVLLDWDIFYWAVVEEQGNMVSGLADWPFTRQYRHTTAYLYFIEQQVKWGLGWPLGVLAFAGFAWALLRALGQGLKRSEWIILAWLVPYFGLNGLFLAKFMRYMSPVTPFVIILGVGMLTILARHWGQRWRVIRPLAISTAIIVLASTALWAAMFVNGVYATEHSWVTASRWIYDNVPSGACIAGEHWEEGMPRDWAWLEPSMSPHSHGYRHVQLPMYEPDTAQKYEIIRDTLRQCDYLIIASNRMLRTLPRLSERYPMSTIYYEALFAGDLGYDLVYEHATPPRLGSFSIDDQPADESFTVYDHPKAFVFKKNETLSDEDWFAVLGNTWEGAVHGYIGEPTLLMQLRGAKNIPALVEAEPHDPTQTTWLQKSLDEWPAIDDWDWNTGANNDPLTAILVWLLAIQIVGLFAFPLTFLLFSGFSDKGYLLSKSLGLLLVSYSTWLLAGAGLPANRFEVIVGSLGVLGIISLILAVRHRSQIGTWLRQQWPFLLLGEALFIGVFALFIGLRLANPDLWQPWNGGEKMLEIGFLNAIVRSVYMPPYDPFFSGTFINYYYYGLYLAGVMIKLTGIQPSIAFNLAVALLAALTAVNVFSLAGNLARGNDYTPMMRRVVAGLLAVLFVLFFSNLDGMGQFLRNLAAVSDSEFTSVIPGLETLVRAGSGFINAWQGAPVREYDYWAVSRIIPATINEFPYWSFLFADLHPHMIGIPFTVLFLAVAYAWLNPSTGATNPTLTKIQTTEEENTAEPPLSQTSRLTQTQYEQEMLAETPIDFGFNRAFELWTEIKKRLLDLRQQFSVGIIWRWLAFPFVLGALTVINVWDLPTYAGIGCATFAISRYRDGLRPLTITRFILLSIEVGLFTVLLIGTTLLIYRPFFAAYVPLVSGLGFVRDTTPLDEFFKLWGFFLLIICTWLAWQFSQPRTRFTPLRTLGLFVQRWNVFPHLIEIYHRLVKPSARRYEALIWGIGLVLIISLALFFLGYIVVALLIPWLIIAFLLLLRWDVSPAQNFIELLAFTGLLVLIGVQFIFLEDWLGGGDWYRMNTFFKFFIQVWIMFGLAAGVMFPTLWDRIGYWATSWRWGWQTLTIIFIFSSLIFFVLGTPQRNDNRFPGARPDPGTLDGMDYMTVGVFQFEYPGGSQTYHPIELKYDYEAIRWLQENVPGVPTIAEAQKGYYREAGMRVAAYTGLPSILGDLHQNEQHPSHQLGERDGLVRQFWQNPDSTQFMVLAQQLNVTYIYFGQLEQILYGEQLGQKLNHLAQDGQLELVFENEKTQIYRVVATG